MKSIYDYGYSKELYKTDESISDVDSSQIGTQGQGDVYNIITGTTNASLLTGGNFMGSAYIRTTGTRIIVTDPTYSKDCVIIGDITTDT